MNCAVKQIKRSIHLRTGDVKLFNNGVATTKRQRGRLVEFTHRMRIKSTTDCDQDCAGEHQDAIPAVLAVLAVRDSMLLFFGTFVVKAPLQAQKGGLRPAIHYCAPSQLPSQGV